MTSTRHTAVDLRTFVDHIHDDDLIDKAAGHRYENPKVHPPPRVRILDRALLCDAHRHDLPSNGIRQPLPGDDREASCWFKQLTLTAFKAMTNKHFFRGSCRHVWEDRPATGQSNMRRPRQMENLITVQKHPEHVRAPNNPNAAVWCPECSQSLLERGPGWVPQQRVFICRVGCDRWDLPCQDQSTARR